MDFSSLFSSLEFSQRMGKLMAGGKLKVPPPIFTDMEGEFVNIDLDAKTLTVRFPVFERLL